MNKLYRYASCIILVLFLNDITSASNSCTIESGLSVLDIEGHCINPTRELWITEPFYLMQVVPFVSTNTGQIIPPEVIYPILSGSVLTWNDYSYDNVSLPVRIALEFFDTSSNNLLSDGVNSIFFSNRYWEDICDPGVVFSELACQRSRITGSIVTQALGGFRQRYESDIIIGPGPWVLPGITNNCFAQDGFDLRSVLAHEMGHGLGVGHQEGSPRPAMDNYLCRGDQYYSPLSKEKEDLDFIYGIAGRAVRTIVQSPEDNTTINWLSDLLDLIGVATDNAGNDVSSQLEWVSSIQGLLGTGPEVNNVELIPGEHIITLNYSEPDSGSNNFFGKESDAINNEHTVYLINQRGRNSNANNLILESFMGDMERSAVTVTVQGPIVEEFSASNNPCFISPGQSICSTTLNWDVSGDLLSGQIRILNPQNAMIASGRSGSVSVNVGAGGDEFRIVLNDASGIDRDLGQITVLAGEISGQITGPSTCEIDPPPDSKCYVNLSLSGFARDVILFNSTTQQTLLTFSPNGDFSSEVVVEIPVGGATIGLFSENLAAHNLLEATFISTFRNADLYEYDGFPAAVMPLDSVNDLEPIFLNGVQSDHNFHKFGDDDYIRIPYPSNTGGLSLRTFNIGGGITTSAEIGCMRDVSGGWQYQPLTGFHQGNTRDGLEDGSIVLDWPSGSPPPVCGGNNFIAKVSRATGVPGLDASYDLRLLDSIEDLYEPDDQRVDATVMTLNEVQNHNLFGDAVDWYEFTPPNGGNFEVVLNSIGPNILPCIKGYVGNSVVGNVCANQQGADLTLAFSGGQTHHFQITTDISRAGTDYQVSVEPASQVDLFEPDNTSATAKVHSVTVHTNPRIANQVPSVFFFHDFTDNNSDWAILSCDIDDICNANLEPPFGSYSKLMRVFEIDNSQSGVNVCMSPSTPVQDTPIRFFPCNGSTIGPDTEYTIGFTCGCVFGR